jgi:hypothetical protein
MRLKSANILLEGKREIRSIGDPCDPACHLWTFCSNSLPNGTCEGFIILNGDSRRLINQNLKQDDLIYVQNCAKIAQSECDEETRSVMVNEILRYIPQRQSLRLTSGFRSMLDAAFPDKSTTPQPTPHFERRGKAGFMSMLEGSRERQMLGEITFPQICSEKCQFFRNCPYGQHNLGQICVNRVDKNR